VDHERLAGLARKLRWIRGTVREDVSWRGRRAIPSLGDQGARLRDVLDPRTKPASSWANLVDAVTEEATATPPAADPERLQAELADAQRTPELLVAWLIRAIDALKQPTSWR